MFIDERTTVTISQSAQNIPVDRIESPFRLNIQENQSTLKDSRDFRLALYENRFLKDQSVHEEIFSFDTPGDHTQRIQFSDAENYLNNNNNQTRREYPLVLILHSAIDGDSKDFFQLPIQVATLHVKSSVSTDPPTKFIIKISKLSDGRSLVLQDIFTPGAFISDDACAICLTEHVTHLLLPCKHACICQNCFNLIDKCPVCQRLVVSYIKI